MAKKISKKEKQELDEIKKEVKKPAQEEKRTSIVKNEHNSEGKKIKQFRVNIPKKFADFLELDDEKTQAKATLDKENKKIHIEIDKNG